VSLAKIGIVPWMTSRARHSIYVYELSEVRRQGNDAVSGDTRARWGSPYGRSGRPGFPATTVPAGTDFVTTVPT
jgi:hypothetical protein